MKFKKLHILMLRYKNEIKTMSIVGIALTLIFLLFYPGEESMKSMFNLINDSALAGLFNYVNVESPGWILWISLFLTLLNFYILAFSGIAIGTKIFPTIEEDGIEVYFTNSSIPVRKFYLGNYFAAIVSLAVIIMPIFVITCGFSFIHSSFSIFDELILFFIISLAYGIFFLTLSSLASILRFSKSFGRTIGYSYLIFSFLLDILSSSPEYAKYANLSINHYLNATQILFLGTSGLGFSTLWTSFSVILGISLSFLCISLWKLKDGDYLEKVKELKVKGSSHTINPFEKYLSPDSSLAKKYPLFANQLQKDLMVIIILIFIITLQQYALFTALPSPDQLIMELAQSNSPIYGAFAQNHALPASLLGFIILKFYSALWIYFGIVMAIMAVRIPNRDVRNSTHDILFANNISPKKLILSRTLSMLLSFSILTWGSFFIIRALQSNADFDIEFQLQAQVFAILWIHYMGMAIFLIGISLIPLVSKGKNLALLIFIFFIFMNFIPFLNQNLEFLKYLSYLSYYDPVGMLVGGVKFRNSLLISLSMMSISIIFTYSMIKFKFSKTDLR